MNALRLGEWGAINNTGRRRYNHEADLTWTPVLPQQHKASPLLRGLGEAGNCENTAIIFLACALTIQFIALLLTAAFHAHTAVKRISGVRNTGSRIYGSPRRGPVM